MEFKNVKPPCKYYDRCGGCQLQHLKNEDQNKYKQNRAEEILVGFGEINPILTMEEPYYYRNKIHKTFAYGRNKEILSGMYAKNSHDVIDIDKCMIQDPIADEITKTIKQIMKKYKKRMATNMMSLFSVVMVIWMNKVSTFTV